MVGKSKKKSPVLPAAATYAGEPRRQACVEIAGEDEQLMFADGYDEAIMGLAERDGALLVVYDSAKVIAALRRRDGMSREEAEEFFAFNIAGAWMGGQTPMFVARVRI